MMPDANKWIFDTISLIVVVGVMVLAALWTSGTSKRK
jgi:hypothetical protein